MNNENKVVHLVDYIEQNKKIESVSADKLIPILGQPGPLLLKRGLAFMVDMMAIALLKTSLDAGYGLFINQYLSPFNSATKYGLTQSNIALHLSVFVMVFLGYFLFTTAVMNGKTLGKLVMKLTIINELFVQNHFEESHELSYSQVFQRSIGYVLCYLSFGTFFVFNFSSEDKRGLSDYLSNTRTVNDEWLSQMLEHKEFSAQEVQIDIASLDQAA
jgi:uncharacterized RDD family membrane protein YckC